MLTNETSIRVRYSETDQMGYVYYGNYAQYFEIGRVELLRSLGVSYKTMEENGVMLPVVEMKTKYFKPAKYDDFLTLKTSIKELPGVRIKFYYELYNETKELLTTAEIILVFIDKNKNKPIKAPDYIISKIKHNSL